MGGESIKICFGVVMPTHSEGHAGQQRNTFTGRRWTATLTVMRMSVFRHLCSVVAVLCMSGLGRAAESLPAAFDTIKANALQEEIRQAVADGRIIGGVVWVERAGNAFHFAVGRRSTGQGNEPMTEDAIFDLASLTKVVATASAAMVCEERGMLRLDDPVSRYLPGFVGEGREQVTIRHLLLHTSGLQVNLNAAKEPLARTRTEAYALACRERPRFEPGSAFAYSSAGSLVLGLVVEKASGRPLDVFCAEQFYVPLGMTETTFHPSDAKLALTVPTSAPTRGVADDHVARTMGGVAGHAGLFSTASDLARFVRMLTNGGELAGNRVLMAETVRQMTSAQSPSGLRSPEAGNLPVTRGLGWDIHTPYRLPPHPYSLARGAVFPMGSYGHTGWTGQMLWVDPTSGAFVIFLCNRYRADGRDTRSEVQLLHHRIATLAAETVRVGARR